MKLYDIIRKEQSDNPKWGPAKPELAHYKKPPNPRQLSWKKVGIVSGAILFLIIIYVLGIKFVQAKVVVTERRIPITLTGVTLELAHQKDVTDGRLSFQTMVVNTTITREVYGSDLKNSVTKAAGTVVFFNEYSKSAQTVKKGITLTATNGKKYVTQEAVTVPGYTMNGKLKVPGTTNPIKILAADTGSTYNTNGTSFVVSGWTNASKTFYARSAGAITGGEAGIAHALTPTEREQAIETLKTQLIERLKRESRAQIPDNLVTFPELQFPIIDTNSLVLQGSGVRFPASMTGTMVSYLISRELLEQAIAAKAVHDSAFARVSIPDLADLSIDLHSPVPVKADAVPATVMIGVSGSATIIAKVPIETLKESLVGLSRRSFNEKLVTIPEVDTAQVRLFPFWSPMFPSVEKKITITTK